MMDAMRTPARPSIGGFRSDQTLDAEAIDAELTRGFGALIHQLVDGLGQRDPLGSREPAQPIPASRWHLDRRDSHTA